MLVVVGAEAAPTYKALPLASSIVTANADAAFVDQNVNSFAEQVPTVSEIFPLIGNVKLSAARVLVAAAVGM